MTRMISNTFGNPDIHRNNCLKKTKKINFTLNEGLLNKFVEPINWPQKAIP